MENGSRTTTLGGLLLLGIEEFSVPPSGGTRPKNSSGGAAFFSTNAFARGNPKFLLPELLFLLPIDRNNHLSRCHDG
jgi:hypothetical protein